jgi:hypothetical protein
LGAQDRDELATSYYERALNDVVAHLDVAMLRVDHADWTEIDFVTDYLEAWRSAAEARTGRSPPSPSRFFCARGRCGCRQR